MYYCECKQKVKTREAWKRCYSYPRFVYCFFTWCWWSRGKVCNLPTFMLELVSDYLKKCKTSSTTDEVTVMLTIYIYNYKTLIALYGITINNNLFWQCFDYLQILERYGNMTQHGSSYILELHIFSYIQQHVSFHKSHIDNPLLCSRASCTLETCRLTKYLGIKI